MNNLYHCAACGKPMGVAPGIGPYCENVACANIDGPTTEGQEGGSQAPAADDGEWLSRRNPSNYSEAVRAVELLLEGNIGASAVRMNAAVEILRAPGAPAPVLFRVSIGDHHAEIRVSPNAPAAYHQGMIETVFAEVLRRAAPEVPAAPAAGPFEDANLNKVFHDEIAKHAPAPASLLDLSGVADIQKKENARQSALVESMATPPNRTAKAREWSLSNGESHPHVRVFAGPLLQPGEAVKVQEVTGGTAKAVEPWHVKMVGDFIRDYGGKTTNAAWARIREVIQPQEQKEGEA